MVPLGGVILLPILVFQLGLIFVQVVLRYGFSYSLSVGRIGRYLFVWLMWLGVSYAARNRTHLRVTMIRDKLPTQGRRRPGADRYPGVARLWHLGCI